MTSGAASETPGDGGAVFLSARLADYGRLADRLATLATSAYIVTRRHPDDLNAAAILRELLTLALDAHAASIAQNCAHPLHFVDLRGRAVDAADWHDLDRMRDTCEALRHIVARLTAASAPAAEPAAPQTARGRRPTLSPPATPDAPVASSVAPTRKRKGHCHA